MLKYLPLALFVVAAAAWLIFRRSKVAKVSGHAELYLRRVSPAELTPGVQDFSQKTDQVVAGSEVRTEEFRPASTLPERSVSWTPPSQSERDSTAVPGNVSERDPEQPKPDKKADHPLLSNNSVTDLAYESGSKATATGSPQLAASNDDNCQAERESLQPVASLAMEELPPNGATVRVDEHGEAVPSSATGELPGVSEVESQDDRSLSLSEAINATLTEPGRGWESTLILHDQEQPAATTTSNSTQGVALGALQPSKAGHSGTHVAGPDDDAGSILSTGQDHNDGRESRNLQDSLPVERPVDTELGHEEPVVETSVEFDPDLNDASGSGSTTPTRRYRPQSRFSRPPVTTRPLLGKVAKQASKTKHPLCLEVRVIFESGGMCTVSLLPENDVDLGNTCIAQSGTDSYELTRLDEDWFEDIQPPNIGEILLDGTEWRAKSPTGPSRWLLTGREIHVLGSRPDLRGFVSTSKLRLGELHIVLCSDGIEIQVCEALKACGVHTLERISKDDGLPLGWTAFKNVIPTMSVTPSLQGEILDCLRPTPDLKIGFSGGVRLQHRSWLLGFPPMIKVTGTAKPEIVRIDGNIAELDKNAAYSGSGWNQIGEHIVTCGEISRTYSIVDSDATWYAWPAHSFELHTRSNRTIVVNVCGGSVFNAEARALTADSAHSVLIGARPGEIYFSSRRAVGPISKSLAFPPFQPIWAVPQEPLTCDKTSRAVKLVGDPSKIEPLQYAVVKDSRLRGPAMVWARTILDCARKGLKPKPDAASGPWSTMLRNARMIWRMTRAGR